jgi:hypothetical protein
MTSSKDKQSATVARFIESALDKLRSPVDFITFLSLRFLCNIRGCTIESVRRGFYTTIKPELLNLDDAKDLDLLLAQAKDQLKQANDRRDAITDKCKTLLTLGSLLVALMGVFLSQSLTFRSLWLWVIFFFAAAFLVNVVLLILVYFAVRQEQVVCLLQDDVSLDAVNLRKSLINAYCQTQSLKDNQTDYLTDIYKVARFCFLIAFIMIAFLVSLNVVFPQYNDDQQKLIQQLRSDTQLIDLLRGPKGDKGDRGPAGQPATTSSTSPATHP